jgi:hypothetical protein
MFALARLGGLRKSLPAIEFELPAAPLDTQRTAPNEQTMQQRSKHLLMLIALQFGMKC